MVGVNQLFWIFKSHHLHLTCFFDFFWREMACPKNKNAQEKAVHFFFSTHVPNSILRYFIEISPVGANMGENTILSLHTPATPLLTPILAPLLATLYGANSGV